MREADIQLERLNIAVYGVSAEVVEEAMQGLEESLRRRLQGLALPAAWGSDLSELAVDPVYTTTVLDAAALRGIIADRLVQAILSAQPLEESE